MLALLIVACFALIRSSGSVVVHGDAAEVLVHGIVLGSEGPIAGALVCGKGTSRQTSTDTKGRFALTMPSGSHRVTATKAGYLIGGATPVAGQVSISLRALPEKDCSEYRWVDPRPDASEEHNCANCHQEIYRQWAGGGHAGAATNRKFLNLYDGTNWQGKAGHGWSLLADHPHGAGVCASCHAPALSLDDPAQQDIRLVKGTAVQGVHCDFCHKVSDMSQGTLGLAHGRYALELLRPEQGQLFFGTLADVDRDEDVYSPLHEQSRFCASCHEGTVFGVPVYSTFTEWQASPAGKRGQQCQACHMRPTGTMKRIATGGIERDPATLSSHQLLRGSRREMLLDCLHLNAKVTTGINGVRLDVTIHAENVGHRVPTGYPDRHLILLTEAVDQGGQSVALQQGPVLEHPGDATLVGHAGKLYAKLLFSPTGSAPIPFWREHGELHDTRLEPGKDDRSRFVFARQARKVHIRLLYRRFWRDVAKEKNWPINEIVVHDEWIKIEEGTTESRRTLSQSGLKSVN